MSEEQLTYEVVHCCHDLPLIEVVEKGLTVDEAEIKVKELYDKKKESRHPEPCCKYFIREEEPLCQLNRTLS